jgi:hypothetical protein
VVVVAVEASAVPPAAAAVVVAAASAAAVVVASVEAAAAVVAAASAAAAAASVVPPAVAPLAVLLRRPAVEARVAVARVAATTSASAATTTTKIDRVERWPGDVQRVVSARPPEGALRRLVRAPEQHPPKATRFAPRMPARVFSAGVCTPRAASRTPARPRPMPALFAPLLRLDLSLAATNAT